MMNTGYITYFYVHFLLQELASDNSLVFPLALHQQVTVQAKQITDKVCFLHSFVYFIVLLGQRVSDNTYSELQCSQQ